MWIDRYVLPCGVSFGARSDLAILQTVQIVRVEQRERLAHAVTTLDVLRQFGRVLDDDLVVCDFDDRRLEPVLCSLSLAALIM